MLSSPFAVTWRLRRTRPPRILHRCSCRPGPAEFEPTGRFRVNANRKLLDVWLLLRCARCGQVLKATVLERVAVRSVAPALLDGYQRNRPDLVEAALAAPSFRRRNHLRLDFQGTWELAAEPLPPAAGSPVTVEVEFLDALEVRPAQLIAAGLGLSRRTVERLLADGAIRAAVRPDAETSEGFRFTVERPAGP
jgi:hypothetical protein